MSSSQSINRCAASRAPSEVTIDAISQALFCLALVRVTRGELEVALSLTVEGLALAQVEGDRRLTGRHQVILGLVTWMKGDYVLSRPYFQEALRISRELGDDWNIAITLANLGFVTRGAGDDETARSLHREGLPMSHRFGNHAVTAWHLTGLAGFAIAKSRGARAARLLGAAASTLKAMGSLLPSPQREEHDGILERTRGLMGDDAFAAALARGQEMPLEEAIAYALTEAD